MRTRSALAVLLALVCPGASCVVGVIAGEDPTSTTGAANGGDQASGAGEAGSGAEVGESGPLLDVDTTGGVEYVDWLLNSEQGALYHVSREDALPTWLCNLVDPDDGTDISFSSMTFSRDDRLFGSGANELYEVTLPECEVIKVGLYGTGIEGVNGISPDEGFGLFAVDSDTDGLYRVDPDTAVATLVGNAGYDIGFGGASWVETEQKLMAIDANNDSLYEVDTQTGLYTLVTALTETFGLVGFEHHPHGGQLYGCTNNNGTTERGLYEIGLDGTMTFIGDIGFSCNDLAAPWASPTLPDPG
jgi:hypothetical protein